VPAANFWSVRLYEAENASGLANGQPFPSLGSRDEPVQNADGGTDLYLGPKAPEGKEKNWLATVPGKGYFAILRLYGPTPSPDLRMDVTRWCMTTCRSRHQSGSRSRRVQSRFFTNGAAMIDAYFFKATATVIPTLLIGVVFTGKLMDNWKLELDERTSHVEKQGRIAEYVGGITFVGWLLLAAIVGEGAALAALVSGIPRLIYLVLVVVAISSLLACLGVMVLAQAISRVEQHDPKKATGGYILIGVGLAIFLLLILSAMVSPETFKDFFK
jgi:hypothetical protein